MGREISETEKRKRERGKKKFSTCESMGSGLTLSLLGRGKGTAKKRDAGFLWFVCGGAFFCCKCIGSNAL